ncbi:hypothetical protein C482_04346 [Natrialba chahannaoensis JCM 10990]|uniref:Uncharacterized protein n=1 Tax=Natrialba chahannaoensis JCM 10990 TaxID=1227492 RepID=M0AX05_9EURY|nr:hypothetical protein [Natrialba chahannaoensis]ELZ02862.1 hypothetical protein C482_04346 [Natrialba chahannaoensis JCM 10990]
MDNEKSQPLGQSVARFHLIPVLKTILYSITIPNGLIVGVVGFSYILSMLGIQIFDLFAEGVAAGFLMLWVALLIGGLCGSAAAGWITAKRYGTTTPLLLIVPFGLVAFPLYFFQPWEGIPPLGSIAVTLIVPLFIGTVGAIAGVLISAAMK